MMRLSPWRALLVGIDIVCVCVAMILSAVLLYDGRFGDIWSTLRVAVLLTALTVPLFHYLAGLYNRIWEYAHAGAALSIGVGVTTALLGTHVICRLIGIHLPVALWYVTWLTSVGVVGATRLCWRMIRPVLGAARGDRPRRILIYGTGPEACLVPTALTALYGNSYCTVGYIDDDPKARGLIIGTARVLGSGEDLGRILLRHRVDEVVITLPPTERERMRFIYDRCTKANVSARPLPPFLQMDDDAQITPSEVRAEDLLNREAAPANMKLDDEYLAGKTVLVTGAGGSIGSELCRQICHHHPQRLLLMGRGENRIHWIYLSLRQRYPDLEIVPIIQNVTVASGVRKVFAEYRPQVVFHCAAHKHVYLMEREPVEAVRNNVLGTRIVAEAAEEFAAERFVFISTDKAVAPGGVMGATKRVGELLLTTRPHSGTDFVCVRFGNVLGSEGSVLEIFRRQWQRREPLTVTDPAATRYFMTIPEACLLVLQAGAMGEHGQVFVLDMGEPVSIMQLAQEFILLHGGNPYDPDAIRITGLKRGEKLHERLVHENETLVATRCSRIQRINSSTEQLPAEVVAHEVELLARCVSVEDEAGILETLSLLTGSAGKMTRRRVASA